MPRKDSVLSVLPVLTVLAVVICLATPYAKADLTFTFRDTPGGLQLSASGQIDLYMVGTTP